MSRADIISRLLAELYDRQRPTRPSQNKSLTKSLFPSDVVAVTDTQTLTAHTPPFKWAPVTGVHEKLVWGQGQWR